MAASSAAGASAKAAASTAAVAGSSNRLMARAYCSGCAVSETYAAPPKSHQEGGADIGETFVVIADYWYVVSILYSVTFN